MNPEPVELLVRLERTVGHEKNAPDDPGEISEVKDVVGLGGRGQELQNGLFVYFHGGLDNHLANARECGVEAFGKVPVGDSAEDFDHCVIGKRVHANDVQVTCQAACDVVATTPRWTHGSNK